MNTLINLAKEWHPTKNEGIKFETLTEKSNRKVWWICEKGHPWEAIVQNRTKRGDGCPYCSGRYATEETCIATVNPDLSKEWHPTKNGKNTIYNTKAGSSKRVWWLCKKGHEWDAVCSSRNRGNGCPYCSGKLPSEEYNLEKDNPELVKEWSYKLNGELLPKDFTPRSNKKVWWECCECGFEWESAINMRNSKNNKRGCPECAKGQQTSFPEKVIYHYLKNIFENTHNPYIVPCFERRTTVDIYVEELGLFIEYDGEYAHKEKASRDEEQTNKICAEGMKLIRVREPKLPKINIFNSCIIEREDSHSNKSLKKVILEIRDYILKNFDLKEKQLEGVKALEYIVIQDDAIKIEERIRTKKKEESLEETHPHIAVTWNYNKNGKLKPSNFTFGSNKTVWWICEKGHDYPCSINGRVKSTTTNCPYCSNKKLHQDNSLATVCPEIAKEWNTKRNKRLTPNDFIYTADIKVWWKCEKEHEWDTTIRHRTVAKTGCPYCSNSKASIENSISVTHKDLVKEWHPTKNELKPTEVTSGSEKRIWWCCSTCKFEWDAFVYHRANGTGCPKCSNKKIGEKTKERYRKKGLEKMKKIAEERNGTFLSDDYNGAREEHEWICEKGHNFTMKPRSILENGNWCTACSSE